ncbi:MAG TPA: ATP-binding protein [Terriglobia bacterium]|nr:ATP-binding protein [Terriglobia bacterium]
MATDSETERAPSGRKGSGWASVSRAALQVIGGLSIVAGVTFVCFRLLRVNATTAGFAYLLAVLSVATLWGLLESVLASIAAVLALNFFFLPPILTLTVADPQNWVALFAFLVTSIIASQISARAKERTREAWDRQRDMERLYSFSRSILLTITGEGVASQIIHQIAQIFDFSAAALLDRGTGAIHYSGPEDIPDIDDRLRETALKGTLFREEATGTVVTAVRLGGEPIGSLALRGALPSDTVLQALANLAAIGLERARVQDAANRAEAARQSQELKSTLLDAMAHEFKTPLTAMKAATSALLCDAVAGADGRRELVTVVDEEVDRLNRMVTEAIETARIEAGALQLVQSPQLIAGILSEVRRDLEAASEGRPVSIEIEPDVPKIEADAGLIELAVRQLLENALRYSAPGSPIVIRAWRDAERVIIGVRDRGPGIPGAERDRIFDKLYRGSNTGVTKGTGMGLAIAREIARAHGGEVWLENSSHEGSEFRLSLPLKPVEVIT